MHFNKKLRTIVLQAAPHLKESVELVLKSDNGEMKLDLSQKLDCSTLEMEVKSLAIGGTGGEALAIDEILMADIVDRAVNQYSSIFTDLDIGTVGSVNYRGLTERTEAGVAKGVENVAGLPQLSTSTGKLEQLIGQVGKAMIKTFITQEAVRDTQDSVSLWDYLVDSSAKAFVHYFTMQLIAGDGKPDNLRGILSSKRVDLVESLKDDYTRDADFFQITKSLTNGEYGSTGDEAIKNITKFLNSVPSKNRKNSKLYMNPSVLADLEHLNTLTTAKLRIKDHIINDEVVVTVNGFVVGLEDMMPTKATDATVMVVGDVNAAISFNWHDNKVTVDPFSEDGAIKYTQYPRASERVKDNTALRMFTLSA
jgi:HK97 family phage major capsid protein